MFFFFSWRFGNPYGRPGDSFLMRETPGKSGRVGMIEEVFSKMQGNSSCVGNKFNWQGNYRVVKL